MFKPFKKIVLASLLLIPLGFLSCERETEQMLVDHESAAEPGPGLRQVTLPVSKYFEEGSRLQPGEILSMQVPRGNGSFWDLELQKGDILSPDFEVRVTDESGTHVAANHDFVFLRGISRQGKGDEEVRVLLSDKYLYAHIPEQGQSYEIWPQGLEQKQAEAGACLIGKEKDFVALSGNNSVTCPAPVLPPAPAQGEPAPDPESLDKYRSECWKVQMLAQADYEYHQQAGYDTQVGSFVIVVNVIRADEKFQVMGMDLELTGVTILTAPNAPLYYPTSSNIYTLLDQTRNALNFFLPPTNRDLAVLFSGKNFGHVGGLAYFSTICNRPDYAYAVVSNRFGYPLSMLILAHEIGHLFEARHLDQEANGLLCPGYHPTPNEIMNSTIYSDENMQFSSCSQSEIRWHVFFNNGCLHQAACN